MKPKNVIVWILLLGIVVLTMSTSVQAKELTEITATDILEKIENGEDIFLENVCITGELDLNKIELETVPNVQSVEHIEYENVFMWVYKIEEELKIVESNIIILNSTFEEDVDFSNTIFRKNNKFSKTSFSSNADFESADFSGDADFESADFSGDADFRSADFSGDPNFRNADFSGDAFFWYADFAGDASFMNADFAGDASFRGADFSGKAYFESADFSGDADFSGADFSGDADFESADFSGKAYFSGADFSGDADFESADFAGDATFFSTEFDEVTFTRTSFTNVYLNESEFNRMKVKWSSLKDAFVFNGPAHIKLIKNFRETEQFEDADAAYYQYRQLSQASKKWSYSKLMDVVAGASCGYGVKPERPLIWAFVLIMVFTLVYWRGKGIKRLKGNNEDNNRVSRWAAFYNSFYFSVVTFTTVGYGDWYPEDRYRIAVMIEGVLGWLLLALFIVTLANVMIRP